MVGKSSPPAISISFNTFQGLILTMSDPLSLTASVVEIVGALLHGSKRLYKSIDSLQNAPKD